MAIISKETFDKFLEEEKKSVMEDYQEYVRLSEDGAYKSDRFENLSRKRELERLFGKENLLPEPEIKTWDDVVKHYPHFKDDIDKLEHGVLYGWDGMSDKIIATYKISKLIELGYGGMVSDEEWGDTMFKKYAILYRPYKNGKKLFIKDAWEEKCFIAFHTKEQATDFMSYPENRTLAEQYFLI